MTASLARRLLRGRVLPSTVVEAAMVRACTGEGSLVQVLLSGDDKGVRAPLEAFLERSEVPLIATVRIVPELFAQLPRGMAERLMAVPVRRDLRLGTVDVAAVDPGDPHIAQEFSFHLRTSIRMLRTPHAALKAALAGISPRTLSNAKLPTLQVLPELTTPFAPHSKPEASTGSEPPVTRRGVPPAPGHSLTPPLPTFGAPQAETRPSEPAIPLVRRSLPPPVVSRPPTLPIHPEPLAAIRAARSLQEVVEALCEAAPTLGAKVVVFAVKGKAYQAQACSVGAVDLKSLEVSLQATSVLSAAVERGFYFGSLPDTEAHAGLKNALPSASNSELYALPIKVGSRAVLVLFIAGFEHAYAVTRRADAMAQVASQVLTEIVRTAKK